ncbi:7795_t:CDS:2 [Entrophospora sp. SA101]|nr:7795_t:CDS:2 [Entrophospora sp. SA101]
MNIYFTENIEMISTSVIELVNAKASPPLIAGYNDEIFVMVDSALNLKFNLSEWEFAAYSKPAKTSGEVMLEDLVEGFYMVFPGYRFDILRKLIKSETLKAQ